MDTMAYAYTTTTITNKSNMLAQSRSNKVTNLPSDDDITGDGTRPNPFGELGLNLTELELRETAYEILIAACRSSGSGRPLTYVSSSEKSVAGEKTLASSLSLQRSVTSAAASKVKKALGLKSKKKGLSTESGASQTDNSVSQSKKKATTVGELMRIQMRVTEQTDSRVRRALLRVAAAQLGRRMELMVLPLELLQQYRPSDSSNPQDYELWQKRILKILEAGLLIHPYIPLDKTDKSSQQLRQIINEAQQKPIDTGKHSESMQHLRRIVTSLANRSFDNSISETFHWADGTPLNLKIYQILLEACFDINDETHVIEEVDEFLELIKKTWTVLGLNQTFHNLCLLWVLFNRYVITGEIEHDLLLAADNMLLEVEKDAKVSKNPNYSNILNSTLSLIISWAEKKLLSYHDNFYRGNLETMKDILSLVVLADKILVDDDKRVEWERVDNYIRSSISNAFSQEREKVKKSSKSQHNSLPSLCVLVQNITDLTFNEKEIYSPILKSFHPLSMGVAVATLHTCYGKELKKYISNITELTPDSVQVLIASDKLEKDLVKLAVENSIESEDGGKSIIQEMIPYEAESVISKLVKSWIDTRVTRLNEWVDRNLQLEVWNPQANKERIAPSAIEVLRIIDETLEAFFLLPIPMHTLLLPELLLGFDKCLQIYISKTKSGIGSRTTYMPAMPALTRCTKASKFGVFKRKEKSNIIQVKKTQVNDNDFTIQKLCVRINTLYHIKKELETLLKKASSQLRNTGCINETDLKTGLGKKFEFSVINCVEGINQLSESTAYKIIFHDLNHVFYDYLYMENVSSSRIEPFLDLLEQNLEIISVTVHDRVRTKVITDVMKASFDGFLLVLLAGGCFRNFSVSDSLIIDEDLKLLMDLFWSNGDGLPIELIEKCSIVLKEVLTLFYVETESLVERFKEVVLENYGGSVKSKLVLPLTSGQWNRNEPNTILRVLCHRNDEIATKFLKKTYNLPKRL